MNETRPAVLDTRKLDNYQTIQLYYKQSEGKVKLSAKQEELKNRWEATFAALKKWDYTTEDVLNHISQEFCVDKRTVREDIKTARRMYEEDIKLDWELMTFRRVQSLEAAIIDAHNAEDFGAVARLESIIQKWKPKEIEAAPIDPDRIKPHTILIKSSKEVLKRQLQDIRNKVELEIAEEAEYEEVK